MEIHLKVRHRMAEKNVFHDISTHNIERKKSIILAFQKIAFRNKNNVKRVSMVQQRAMTLEK